MVPMRAKEGTAVVKCHSFVSRYAFVVQSAVIVSTDAEHAAAAQAVQTNLAEQTNCLRTSARSPSKKPKEKKNRGGEVYFSLPCKRRACSTQSVVVYTGCSFCFVQDPCDGGRS